MKITIENVKANKEMFEAVMETVINEVKTLNPHVTITYNNIELSTEEIILSRDKTDIDVLQDLTEELVEDQTQESAEIVEVNDELSRRLNINNITTNP